MEQIRRALIEAGLNSPKAWNKLKNDFIRELNSDDSILTHVEPFFDSWLVTLDHDIDTVGYGDFLINECIPYHLPHFNRVELCPKEKLIKLRMDGTKYCIGKHNEKMFIKRYD